MLAWALSVTPVICRWWENGRRITQLVQFYRRSTRVCAGSFTWVSGQGECKIGVSLPSLGSLASLGRCSSCSCSARFRRKRLDGYRAMPDPSVVAEEKKYDNGKETALPANFFLLTYWRELQSNFRGFTPLGESQFNPGIIVVTGCVRAATREASRTAQRASR